MEDLPKPWYRATVPRKKYWYGQLLEYVETTQRTDAFDLVHAGSAQSTSIDEDPLLGMQGRVQ